MVEHELKFFNVDLKHIEPKIIEAGGTLGYVCTLKTHLYLKDGYNYKDSHESVLRIREIGDQMYVGHKSPVVASNSSGQRKEVELEVLSLEDAQSFVRALGFSYGETLIKDRRHYTHPLGAIEVEIPVDGESFIELETKSDQAMIELCSLLGLDVKDGFKGNIFEK